MTTLYAITPFANPDVQISKYSHEIDPEPIAKTDVTPTTSVQTINKSTDKNIPNGNIINPHSIDNVNNLDYNKDIESPETLPITKNTISNPQNGEVNNDDVEIANSINNTEPVTTEPITKTDIENDTESEISLDNDIDLRNSDFIKKYNDLNNRMNNLYNNEEN